MSHKDEISKWFLRLVKWEETKIVDLLNILLFAMMATAEQPDQKRSRQ